MDMLQGALGSFTAVAFNGAQILVVLVTVFFGVIFMLMNPRPIVGMMFAMVARATPPAGPGHHAAHRQNSSPSGPGRHCWAW
jgi:hypothetical protein